jgi:hypothetical protein
VVAIGDLTCTQTPPSISCTVAPSQKTKSIEWTDPALDMASLHYYLGRDMAVVIGATRAKPGRPVTLDAFLNWLRLTTMDVRGLTYPSGIIPTPHGDLILDPQLRGHLYHNGITFTNSTVGGAFLFAYNFAYSTTCRDRRRLESWRDAARCGRKLYASRKTPSCLYLSIFCGSMPILPTPR